MKQQFTEHLRHTLESYKPLLVEIGFSDSFIDYALSHLQKISETYNLEGDIELWLVCAVYEQFRESSECGALSLDKLLRHLNVSFPNFFAKMKNWVEMSASSISFRDHLFDLEQTFNTGMVLFRKYCVIFSDLFVDSQSASISSNDKSQHKDSELNSDELFYFIWLLYLQIKASLDGLKQDLVKCSQLLLCCVDLVYSNVAEAGRFDLLNANFPGIQNGPIVPKNGGTVACEGVMEILGRSHHGGGQIKECVSVKKHWFIPHMVKMAQEGALSLDPDSLQCFFKPHINHYFANRSYLETTYELFIQKSGQIDERVFIFEHRWKLSSSTSSQTETHQTFQNAQASDVDSIRLNTLSGSRLRSPIVADSPVDIQCRSSNGSSNPLHWHGITRLQAMLTGYKNEPSMALLTFLNECCSPSVLQQITNRVRDMGAAFAKQYESDASSEIENARREEINCLVDMQLYYSETLYFKLLQSMLHVEMKRLIKHCGNSAVEEHQPTSSSGENNGSLASSDAAKACIASLLVKEEFHRSLLACAFEIVLFCYNSKKRLFPWIVGVFDVKPYHFYRVIEMVIKHEEALSRDVVIHLNRVEESVLEEYAWKSDSPLWEDIEREALEQHSDLSSQYSTLSSNSATPAATTGVPRCIDVLLPYQIATISQAAIASSYKATKIQKLSTTAESQSSSPGVMLVACTSAGKQTVFPVRTASVSSGRGQIEAHSLDSSANALATSSGIGSSGHSQQPIHSQMRSSVSSVSGAKKDVSVHEKRRKSSPMALFFRKMYLLASERLGEWISRLEERTRDGGPEEDSNASGSGASSSAASDDVMKKTWSLVENCVVLNTELLLNRHLDQILLSALYLTAKVLHKKWTFESILRAYRMQPQATSDTYRKVLIRYMQTQNGELIECREDIVSFYNAVFVPNCSEYALQFSPALSYFSASSSDSGAPPKRRCVSLDRSNCVVPCSRGKPLAARKVSLNHNLYLMPLKEDDLRESLAESPGGEQSRPTNYDKITKLTYKFSISPSKNLNEINDFIRSREVIKRRYPHPPITTTSSALHGMSSSSKQLLLQSDKINTFPVKFLPREDLRDHISRNSNLSHSVSRSYNRSPVTTIKQQTSAAFNTGAINQNTTSSLRKSLAYFLPPQKPTS